MRRGNNNGFLKNGRNKLCAVNLGADYCAEHEWGIKGIRRHFGLSDDESVCGIERRRVQNIPDSNSFNLVKKDEHWTLIFSASYRTYFNFEDYDPSELAAHTFRDREKDELYTAWSEKDFAVRVYSDAPNADKNKKNLQKLYDAFINKEVAIWVGGGGVFQNGGLILAIIDRCPKDKLQEMKEADEERNRLKAEANRIDEELNLEKRLREAGKDWFALSPRFHNGSWSDKTVFDVIYWLNPYDQENNHFGWVTVEDLVAWVDDKGPIPENGRPTTRQGSGRMKHRQIVDLLVEGLKHALEMNDMELRSFMGLKGSSECPKIRTLLQRKFDRRTA